jgi:predicted alpha-1,2-mannosidase
MQARKRDGSWNEPFDPTANDVDFCEADSWIYTWFVPHDVQGLIDAMGGREAFVAKLDAFFDGGHDDPSNEPAFHTPYLYVYAGAPWKTADRVRAWLAEEFSATPGGLPGNDDAGATSAWYVLSALGLYPVAPGDGVYVLGSPLFERATLHLDPRHFPGGAFVIEAPGTSDTNRYVQRARLNGAPLERAWLWHDEVAAGGTLVLEMGPAPSDWASEPGAAPPSQSPPER